MDKTYNQISKNNYFLNKMSFKFIITNFYYITNYHYYYT